MNTLRTVILAATIAIPVPSVFAQTAATPGTTGTLSGRVVDAQSGEPIRAATVTLSPTLFRGQYGTREAGNLTPLYQGVTRPDGTYEIRGISPGHLLVSVRASARYAPTFFGQTSVDMIEGGSADGTILQIPVRIRAGEATANIDLRVDRISSVHGRVFGAAAQPVPGIEVELLRKPQRAGAAPLVAAFDQTEPDGSFSVRVPPGEYYIRSYPSAQVRPARGGPAAVYAPTFFPGVTDIAKAETVRVGPGQQLDEVAFIVATTTATTVEGQLEDPGGPPFDDALVELVWVGPGSEGERPSATATADGRFEILDVTPGDYVVLVSGSQDPTRWVGVRDPIRVTSAVRGLRVRAARGSHVDVSVRRAADASPLPRLRRDMMFDSLSPTRGPSAGGRIDDDGALSIDLPAGPAGVRVEFDEGTGVGLPGSWFIESARLDGTDVTNAPIDLTAQSRHRLEVVVSNRGAGLTGSVRDASNRPVAYAPVLVFPNDQQRRQLSRLTRVVYSQQDGSFEVSGLPSGTYRIVALSSLAADAWKDAAVLERLHPLATLLQLSDQARRLTLNVAATPADLVP